MGEKRFKLKENLEDVLIEDTITQSQYSIYGIVDLVNEQQDTINKQQAEIERLQKIIDLTQYQLKVQDRILKEVGE